MTAPQSTRSASRPTTTRRSATWRGPANIMRRSATPRPIAGRIMSMRRSSRCESRSPDPASPSSPRRRRSIPPRAIRVRAPNTMAAPNSIRSMTATPRSRTICGFPTSPMIASIPRPRTAAPGFRCRNCSGCARAGRIGEVAPALLRRADQPQPPRHHRDRCARNSRALPSRQRRCRGAGAELPGLPPDHQPGRAAPGGQRHFHRRDGLRQGHRRARRGAALSVLAIFRSAIRPAGRTTRNRRRSPSSSRCGCWKRRRPRRPPCSRRCAGARMPPGSATTTTSPCWVRRSWREGAANSTRRRTDRARIARQRGLKG